MANLSQQKRLRMMEFMSKLKEEHKDDDTSGRNVIFSNLLILFPFSSHCSCDPDSPAGSE